MRPMRSGDLPAYLSLNCFLMVLFDVPGAVLFKFSPEIDFSEIQLVCDLPTDGRTHPLKEMRERI